MQEIPSFTAFPGTEIAKKYGSGCTKSNVLVEMLASDDSIFIASQMPLMDNTNPISSDH